MNSFKRINTIKTTPLHIENSEDFLKYFETYLKNPLTNVDFIDVDITKKLKHKSYKYIFSHHEFSKFIEDYNQVIFNLANLKSKTNNLINREVAIFHDYDGELGAIRMRLGKFFSLFPKILDVLDSELHHDLLIVSLSFSFGICVEIEGLDYSMTVWGVENKPHIHEDIQV